MEKSMDQDTVSARLSSARMQFGVAPQAYLPMRLVPEDVFIETSGLSCSNWPDLSANEIADWPSNSKNLHGETSGLPDVGLALSFCRSLPPDNSNSLLFLKHETSGHWKDCIRFACIPVELSVCGATLGSTIARRWYASGVQSRFSPLADIDEYRSSLRANGLDCNECYQFFAEGVYPVDFDDCSLERLATLRRIEELPFPPEQLEGACFLLLAPNSSA